ncbi:MAG: glycosyltransferase family 1 protein [Armatimonadota bacterium]|nr:glycosyltransferase family 1 protein [Armatimonadota bacterium]
MRIGINAHLYSSSASYRNAGISRYIRGLVDAFATYRNNHEIHIFLKGLESKEFPNNLYIHRSCGSTSNPMLRISWEQTILPLLIKKLGLDIIHSPAYVLPTACPCKSVVTVLDLSFIRFAQYFPLFQWCYLNYFTRRSVRKADAVITISEHSKQEIIKLLHVPENKVFVTHLGVNPSFRPVSAAEKARVCEQYGIIENTVLFVGTLEPRKNILSLIAAFDIVHKAFNQRCSLILVGGKGWFYQELFEFTRQLGIGDSVRFLGYVPMEDLPALYGASAVFVYPSFYEGFGLPPLEAMACGTPVITSNTSSLPEVVGDAGIMVDPHDVEALANAILQVLGDSDLRQEMSARGIERAKLFSWQETARRTLNVYEDIFKRARG